MVLTGLSEVPDPKLQPLLWRPRGLRGTHCHREGGRPKVGRVNCRRPPVRGPNPKWLRRWPARRHRRRRHPSIIGIETFQRKTGSRREISAFQFAEGFSAESITNTSAGTLLDSSFSPSCSCNAANIERPPPDSSAPPGRWSAEGGFACRSSGVHSSFKSNFPATPLRLAPAA